MDPISIVKNTIPNPFSEQSTLSGLVKKGELLKEGVSVVRIIKNLLFLDVIAFALVTFFNIPIPIITAIVGAEIFITLIRAYLTLQKIKAISAIGTEENALSYRNILITSEYYDVLKAILGLVTSSISIMLVFLLFSTELSNISIPNIPIQSDLMRYSIVIFVLYRLFDFIMRAVRYGLIKQLKQSNDLAQINQEFQVIDKKLEIIKFIPAMSAILFIVYLIGIPLFIPLIFGGFMILMIVLSITELKRIQNISFDNKTIDRSTVQHSIVQYQGEQIVCSVFGIMKTAASLSDVFKPFGESVFGSGKMYYPENTLLITNYRIILVQVPVTGGNKIVGGTDYVTQNFYFNRAEIKQKGEELLKINSLTQVLQFVTNDVLYNNIKTLKLKQTQIIIEKTTGEKLSYIFIDKEYIDPIKQALQTYLKEKFTVV